MSDNLTGDDPNVESAKSAVPEDRPVSADDYPSKVTTTTKHEGSASEFDVWWSVPEDEDTDNPRNWSDSQKWTIISSLSLVTFLTYVTHRRLPRATIISTD
ncbi:hypothetical protein PENSUB_7529 [Penicillium subrubescens]|jgi:hypothetical protein|uniref:Uncharacterized protein n=1 Tax=Penicillium subrubescens TaxID=1316194 RepID=A0A1Q5TL48_9EURO|nr:hypothetical protein PENSUB_7529 [Penicillium subrubescens]